MIMFRRAPAATPRNAMRVVEADKRRAARLRPQDQRIVDAVRPFRRGRDAPRLELDDMAGGKFIRSAIETQKKLKRRIIRHIYNITR
jgi:hypothetical protein